MKYIAALLIVLCTGCQNFTAYGRKKQELVDDITILKLEVRKVYLEGRLRDLEERLCADPD